VVSGATPAELPVEPGAGAAPLLLLAPGLVLSLAESLVVPWYPGARCWAVLSTV
jgi:hypothetical protein